MRVIYVFVLALAITNINETAEVIISFMLENHSDKDGFIYTALIRAIPHETQIRNRLGVFPSEFLVPDVILWDPLVLFPQFLFNCPSCYDQGLRERLRAIRWEAWTCYI